MKILASFLIVFISLNVYSQKSTGIQFIKGGWEQILSKAENEQKPIFIDFNASWCGPCKWMAANVFTNDSVADFYNMHFICYASDIEKGDGIYLKKQFDIQVLPTFLYLDFDGKPMHKVSGRMEIQDFIIAGNTAFDSTKTFYYVENKYKNGDRSPDLLYRYSMALDKNNNSLFKKINLEIDTIADAYFKTQSDSELLNKKNWMAMQKMVYSVNDPLFNFVLSHKSDFIQRYDSLEVYHFFYQLTLFALKFYKNKSDIINYNKTEAIFISFHNPSVLRKVIDKDASIDSYFTGLDIKYE